MEPPPHQNGANLFANQATLTSAKPKGSIRVDVLERVGDGTVCVYDIKTGQSGLGIGRMQEIAGNVFTAYPDTTRIVVTEVRPRR